MISRRIVDESQKTHQTHHYGGVILCAVLIVLGYGLEWTGLHPMLKS